MFAEVSEDLLGGTGKAEDVKLQGAGIIPKLCPMESAKRMRCTETSPRKYIIGDRQHRRKRVRQKAG